MANCSVKKMWIFYRGLKWYIHVSNSMQLTNKVIKIRIEQIQFWPNRDIFSSQTEKKLSSKKISCQTIPISLPKFNCLNSNIVEFQRIARCTSHDHHHTHMHARITISIFARGICFCRDDPGPGQSLKKSIGTWLNMYCPCAIWNYMQTLFSQQRFDNANGPDLCVIL